jgi:hypothetical protein
LSKSQSKGKILFTSWNESFELFCKWIYLKA